MQRFSVVDPAAGDPLAGDTYFAPTSYRESVSPVTGRRYKQPKVIQVPGAEPGVVAFADITPYGDDVYIDYMRTRRDHRGRGYSGALADHIATKFPGVIDFGRVMSPTVWNIKTRLAEQGRQTHGYRDF